MKWKYIDTHAHLNLRAFDDDRDAVIAKCNKVGVAMINVGTKLTSQKAVVIAEAITNCYAIVGLHPIQTTQADHDEAELGPGGQAFQSQGEVFDIAAFRELAQHDKVVGIGECGFDFYRCESGSIAVQEEQFIKQVELANELHLPLMIHTRNSKPGEGSLNAYDEVYRVLKQYAKVPGNIHFYAGTWEQASRFFDLGFTISFTGVITFATDYEEVVRNAPLDLIHAETDCPYVAPAPYRGQRAEPWMVKEVVAKIAGLKGLSEEVVREQLLINAARLYSLWQS